MPGALLGYILIGSIKISLYMGLPLARYLQSAMPARNAAFWRSCDSEKTVGPAAHKSKPPQAVGPG